MSAPSYDTPTHTAFPPITESKFGALLKSRNSPAYSQYKRIYEILVQRQINPSFMLAQYRVESQMGTAGHAVQTKSVGNMLWDANLCTHAVGQYAPGNGYTYAKYSNQVDATHDYCNYLDWYGTKYNLWTIYGATARWIGKTPGSSGHLSYIDTIISDMTKYQFVDASFYEVGDRLIYGGPQFDRATGRVVQKYPVKSGDTLYKGTDGTVLKTFSGTAGNAWFLGYVQGSPSWGLICIGTSAADPDATWCFIKNIDPKKIVKV